MMIRFLLATALVLSFIPKVWADNFTAIYGIYTGGFHVVDLVGDFTMDDNGYTMTMNAKTIGLLGRLAPWAGDLQTTGGYTADGTPIPYDHNFASTWKGKVETTTFTYDKKGQFQSKTYIDEDGKVEKNQHDTSLSDNTVDMLTALQRSMLAARQGDCTMSVPSFDGKRRYNMVFTNTGEGEIRENRYSLYAGKAELCTIEIEPDGGKWRDEPRGWMSLQEQAKGKGQLPRLWYAKVNDMDMPLPVKFMIKTAYGTMVMHLRELK